MKPFMILLFMHGILTVNAQNFYDSCIRCKSIVVSADSSEVHITDSLFSILIKQDSQRVEFSLHNKSEWIIVVDTGRFILLNGCLDIWFDIDSDQKGVIGILPHQQILLRKSNKNHPKRANTLRIVFFKLSTGTNTYSNYRDDYFRYYSW